MNRRQKKKIMLGVKQNKNKIRRRIQKVKMLDAPRTIFDGFGISEAFCPFCGCYLIEWSGNKSAYPELWETGYCARCGAKIAGADNSPYRHILRDMFEYPEATIKELQELY